MKGLAEKALALGGEKKKPAEGESEESDSLEVAVSEFFDSTDPKTRAAAFKAAVAMCRGYDSDE